MFFERERWWYNKADDGVYEFPILPKEDGRYYVCNETNWLKYPPAEYIRLGPGILNNVTY